MQTRYKKVLVQKEAKIQLLKSTLAAKKVEENIEDFQPALKPTLVAKQLPGQRDFSRFLQDMQCWKARREAKQKENVLKA